jgi:hypothetical protein
MHFYISIGEKHLYQKVTPTGMSGMFLAPPQELNHHRIPAKEPGAEGAKWMRRLATIYF